jgi:serine protease Do
VKGRMRALWILIPAALMAGLSPALGLITGRDDADAASNVAEIEDAGIAADWPPLTTRAPATAETGGTAATGDAAEAVQHAVDVSRRTAIVQAAERVAPAVVSVNVLRRTTAQPQSLWESLFLGPGGSREVPGLGSGFIIDEAGLVITNEHVVRGATEVVVTLGDGRDLAADVVGTDEVTDLALLRIREPGGRLPVAPLGASNNLIIGEWVVAIGNPFGFLLSNPEPTVTAGVVSGVGRNIIQQGDDRGFYLDMIQTDASINPGNSGGPLVNALGEVIGVNSSIISGSGGSVGLGFAIPMDRARRIVRDLLADGEVRRVWIGVSVQAADPNRLGRSRRVQVASVAPNSPATQAGLRPGMTIVQAGGRDVRTPLDWDARLLDVRVGEMLEVVVEDGSAARQVVRIRAEGLPSLTAERVRAFEDFQFVTLTPAIRAERRLANEQGALIVQLSSAARQVGLREGDLIVQINRTPVRTADEAASLLRRLAGGGTIRVFFERQGQIGSIAFTMAG